MNRLIRYGRNKKLVKSLAILMAVFFLITMVTTQPLIAENTQPPTSGATAVDVTDSHQIMADKENDNSDSASIQIMTEPPIPDTNSENSEENEEKILAAPSLNADTSDNIIGQSIDITFIDEGEWSKAINSILVDGTELEPKQYTVSSEKITINAEVFAAVGEYKILVKANGYTDAEVTQSMVEPEPELPDIGSDNGKEEDEGQLITAPALNADTTDNIIGKPVEITFADEGNWSASISSIMVDGTELEPEQYTVSSEEITINAEVFTAVGEYKILVKANGYTDAEVTQFIDELYEVNSTPFISLMGDLTPPTIMADTTQNLVNKTIELTFYDDSAWRAAITGISLNEVGLESEKYELAEGKITLSSELFTETKDYSITIKATGYTDAEVIQAIQEPLIIITGDGVTTPTDFTENELKAMEQVRERYSTVNTWPTKNWYVAEGVKLADLLAIAGVKDDVKSIIFHSTDGFKARFTADEMLKDKRYYYPNFKENHEYFGYILGSAEGAEEVPTLIALLDSESDNFDYLSDRESPKLVFGQRWLSEQTNSVFAKYTKTIEVSTADPGKWENPVAKINGEIVTGGTVPAGSLVELYTSDMDGDSIHYTTDGTDPTYASPMYNWIKKRWWSSRSDELETINHPIEVKRSMTLKAVSIGFGKNNSDIVTFDFRVTDAHPPTLARDTSNVCVNQVIEIIFPDDQQWVDAITAIKINGTVLSPDKYELTSNKITFKEGVFTQAGDYTITISATDFRDASLVQKIVAENATPPALTPDTSNNAIRQAVELTFDENADWQADIYEVCIDGVVLENGKYTVGSGKITIAANVLNQAKDYNIIIKSVGYNDAVVTQTMKKIPPVLSPDTTDFVASQPIEITFAENADWQAAVFKVMVGETELTSEQYAVGAGKITIVAGILSEVRDYTITVYATGYVETSVTQTIWPDGIVPPTLNADTTDNAYDKEIVLTFADDEKWRSAITKVMAGTIELTSGEQYVLGPGTITIPANVLAIGDYTIVIYADGYKNAVVVQSIVDYPPALTPQTVNNGVKSKIVITYPSNVSYKNAIRAVLVDGTPLPSDKYSSTVNGKITINANVLNEIKDYNIVVQAKGYLDASVVQPIKKAAPTLTKDSTSANVGQPIEITFTDDPDWRAAVTGVTVDGVVVEAEKYTLEAGKLTFLPGVFTESRSSSNPYKIVVNAAGYADSGVDQNINKGSVTLTADTTNNEIGQDIEITFTDDPYWRSVITNVQVDNQDISVDKYTILPGKLIIAADIFTEAKNYSIRVKANGYYDASKTQTIVAATVHAPVAAFTADKTSGTAPLTVQFTDQSANNPSSWAWDFNNDGTIDSTEQNPTYVYNTAGTYTVKLTVSNSAGSDEEIKTDYITVTESVVAVSGVRIAEGNQELQKGQTVQLTAVVEPENATNKNVTWSSSDETVATVSDTGLVTAVAEGAAIITVTTEEGEFSDTISIIVESPVKDVSTYEFEYTVPQEVISGKEYIIPVTIKPATVGQNGYESVRFNINIATPEGATLQLLAKDTNGVEYDVAQIGYWGPPTGFPISADYIATTEFTAIFSDAGQYTISFSLVDLLNNSTNIVSDSATVNVTASEPDPVAVASVSITEGDQELEVDETVQLTAVVEPEDATNKNVSWSSSEEAVATVSETGLVTAVAAGTAEITVTTEDGGKTDSITVTVTAGAANVPLTIAVKENGTETQTFEYNLNDWELERQYYSIKDSSGKYRFGAAEGVYLEDILNDAEIDIETINSFKFISSETPPFTASITSELLNEQRYYYPNIFSENKEDGAQVVKPMLAVKSYVGDRDVSTLPSWDSMDDENTIRLFFGQKNVDDVNYSSFAKFVCQIEVEVTESSQPVAVTGVSITEEDQTLEVGQTVQLTAVVEPENATNKKVTWSSSDETVATVSDTGLVTAVAEGTATITVTTVDGNKTDSITVTVVEGSGQPTMDILYQGTVNLEAGKTFTKTAYNSGKEYTVNENTPLGALHKAAIAGGFTYDVTDKIYTDTSPILLLDNIGSYPYVKSGSEWYAYVNDIYKDGYANPDDALNIVELVDGDKVEFYYADIDSTDLNAVKAAATAAVLIEVDSQAVTPTDWTLQLSGARNENVKKSYFEQGLACASSSHYITWTDEQGNVWGGMPLWLLVGMVDDNPDVGNKHIGFNEELAAQGYDIKVYAGDGFSATFKSSDIARRNDYIVANTLNGQPLPLKTESGKALWPLCLRGPAVTSGKQQVGNIVRIELSGLPEQPADIPELRIVKYGEDGTTIIAEETLTYLDIIEQFDVIGDGTTVYKFQGVTFDPDDIWDENETGKGGYKIQNAVKGTRLSDLCSLVGGMGTGTEIVLIASDGYEVKLPYSSVYPDPSVKARQGDAILAWYADGKYVPEYSDGMRLFFTPEDTVYSQMDMRLTLPEPYWHYYGADGIMYPSCAGISNKNITTIKVYTVPQGDWTLELDGRDIGGLKRDISKTYFESGLSCTMGANHKASYTDSQNRLWEGMPLWFLVGFVDDADQHSNNAFNERLAQSGSYKVVITATDGASVTIDSTNIDRNNNFVVANTLNGFIIPEKDGNWPLRLVGPSATGELSIKKIKSIKLMPAATSGPYFTVSPAADAAYTVGTTQAGISTMTVNQGVSGFKYFTANIQPVKHHDGTETVVFTHLRNGSQLQINSTRADFDQVGTAQAGFNVQAGDVIKVYIVDELTNAADHNPVILQ